MTGDFVSVGDVQTYLLRVDADAEISGPLILIIPGRPKHKMCMPISNYN